MTHDERLTLIYRPFFITTFTTPYPWGGAALTDNFFDPEGREWAQRPIPPKEADATATLTLWQGGDSLATVIKYTW